jgi:hypothetical protein
MTDCGKALKMQKVFLLEDLRHKAHVLADLYSRTVSCGYACAFLASMLQSIESEKGDTSDIFVGGVDPKNAACLVEALQTALPCFGCAPSGQGSHTNSIVPP